MDTATLAADILTLTDDGLTSALVIADDCADTDTARRFLRAAVRREHATRRARSAMAARWIRDERANGGTGAHAPRR